MTRSHFDPTPDMASMFSGLTDAPPLHPLALDPLTAPDDDIVPARRAEARKIERATDEEPFTPLEPTSLEKSGLSRRDVEPLILKFLLSVNSASGRRIADHLKLPFAIVHDVMAGLKAQLAVALKGAAALSDYDYELTTAGQDRARRHASQCTYFGAAPVSFDHYLEAMRLQSIRAARPRLSTLCEAFRDLILEPSVISQLGQSIYAGKGLLLYGAPGNGKSSIAERMMDAVGDTIWIPRTITITGEIIRLFDPVQHREEPVESASQLAVAPRLDRRWARIRRPTVVAGGELTLEQLECRLSTVTGIIEAPLQMKSNGGALVIDDFGRQRITPSELLNRWIVPLEKGHDYLSLPSGRHLTIPFDQLLVFATNLRPTDLLDEAFLRRIPYKIEVFDPNEAQFRALFRQSSAAMGFAYDDDAVTYLIEKHYRSQKRPFRFCHCRDLLTHVATFCEFHCRPLEVTPETLDVAVSNYFAGL
jgi:hypothetical protein